MGQTGPVSTEPDNDTVDGPPPERQHRVRLILASLAGLVATGIVIGLLVSWASTTLIGASGIEEMERDPDRSGAARPTGDVPAPQDPSPSPSENSPEGPSESAETAETAPDQTTPTTETEQTTQTEQTTETEPTTGRTREPEPDPSEGTLSASTTSAAAYEPLTLSGTFPGAAGSTLQVERLEGGSWVAFPTTATADGSGSFSTYVELGQPGENLMRVTLPGTDRSTPTVAITIS